MKSDLAKKIKTLQPHLVVMSLGILLLSACSNSGEGVNPGLVDMPLVYAKRTIPVEDDGITPRQYDVREPLLFSEGGDVYIRTTSSSSVAERNITRSVTAGVGDVKDLEASYDGNKVIFSLRLADPDPNDPLDDPTWNIYEYDIENDVLRRVIADDIEAERGNDIAPYYLPDGRIVFSSDRQTQSKPILSDENKRQFAYIVETGGGNRGEKALVLHVMESNGGDIHQISFNQSHDLDPVVMPDGRILFSRWDGAGANDTINLYTVHPDGAELELYYGDKAASHRDANDAFMQLTQPRVMQDGRVLVLARPNTGTYAGGDLIAINGEDYIENNQSIFSRVGALTGMAQAKITVTNVISTDISRAGRYSLAYPLLDGSNRLIVSKGTCQITNDDIADPNITIILRPCVEPFLSAPVVTEMPYSYGLWMYDMNNNVERPIINAEQGYILTDVVVAQAQEVPDVIYDKGFGELDATLVDENVGVLDIRSVYDMGDATFNCRFYNDSCTVAYASLSALSDMATPADNRPARFLRLIKPVSIPDMNDAELDTPTQDPPNVPRNAFGVDRSLGMREIIGYTMIEPDGSVRVKVPANVAFGIEVLDKFGRRIGARHDNWLQVRAGDTLKCDGCHEVTNGVTPLPHGRKNAQANSINAGITMDGYVFTNTRIPGTTDSSYFGDYGETMAQVRTRIVPTALTPSVNVVYDDAWTIPVMSPTPVLNPSINYDYADLTTPHPVSNGSCLTLWDNKDYVCRTVINYTQHIQPIWNVSRGTAGADTCTATCHTTNGNTQVPAGQLDLTDALATVERNRKASYLELFEPDTTQELIAGVLGDKQIPVTVLDVNGNPVTTLVTDPAAIDAEAPTMSASGARASSFMTKMNNAADSHYGYLTDAEKRLITEWLDLGGQYFNNPFAVPAN